MKELLAAAMFVSLLAQCCNSAIIPATVEFHLLYKYESITLQDNTTYPFRPFARYSEHSSNEVAALVMLQQGS